MLSETVKEFRHEKWIGYWILRSLTNKYGKMGVAQLKKMHEETMQILEEDLGEGQETLDFLQTQLELLTSLADSEEKVRKLQERGLEL